MNFKETITFKNEHVAVEVLERDNENNPVRVKYEGATLRHFKEVDDWFIEVEHSPNSTAQDVIENNYAEEIRMINEDVLDRIMIRELISQQGVVNFVHKSCNSTFNTYNERSKQFILVFNNDVDREYDAQRFMVDSVFETLGDVQELINNSKGVPINDTNE